MKQTASLPPKAARATCAKCGAEFPVAFLYLHGDQYRCRNLDACNKRQVRTARNARPPEKKS